LFKWLNGVFRRNAGLQRFRFFYCVFRDALGLNEEHEESLNHMRELATKTISAKEVENCLSLADQWGSSPPLRPEPQVNKKSLQKLVFVN